MSSSRPREDDCAGAALSLAEMVRHREQHAESDQHSEPRALRSSWRPFRAPYYQAHILCAWKAPRLGQEILKFERIRELPPGVAYMPKPWQPLNVLIAAEQALASGRGN
jgi:hypothetical protein